ncbi:MAG TPA: hypothetical protein VH062_17855 [Polyangiaceae bacterium]|jgi:hypothetical protein|nr:hypothetical protein [Polyangiaceae bacterium]
MNSLKSLCSWAKGTPLAFDELEQQLETSLGRQVRIKRVISLIRLRKTAEDSSDAFHVDNVPRPTRRHHVRPVAFEGATTKRYAG